MVEVGEKSARGTERPVLVLMHFLGGSGREWDEVVELLGEEYEAVRVDLPGFGDAAGETGYEVAAMAGFVEARLGALGQRRYVLVGHSMSAKVALVLARRAADAGRGELAGLVLVAGSPAGPEPMTEEKRGGLVALLGAEHADDRSRARGYITKNETRDIPAAVLERATLEVLRMNRTAWVAWLLHGSREDWAERVGVLETPAMVVAGEKDTSLGEAVQREAMLPHLARARMVVVRGSGHLVPMEKPGEMARALREFVDEVQRMSERGGEEAREPGGMVADTAGSAVPEEYLRFIAGERVSARTREVLEARMAGPGPHEGVLTEEQERVLRAMVARVLPEAGLDVAGYVMARLASGKGDGWRYAVLPGDVTAYREGLDGLAERGFTGMSAEAQDEVLRGLEEEKGSAAARWFEEVRADAVEAWIAHPKTMARVGFSGPGVGGAATKFKGYVLLGANAPEAWEPRAEGRS